MQTIIGLYNYMQFKNDDLFALLELPDGIDKDTLVFNILDSGSEFEVINQNAEFVKQKIGIWGKKYYWTFDKWIKALSLDYNPLENYDRMESWTDASAGSHRDDTTRGSTENRTDTSIRDTDGSFSNTNTNTAETTTVNSVSAYNSDTFENNDKSVTNNSATATASGSNSEDETVRDTGSTTVSATDSNVGNDRTDSEHSGRIHGNIGVTTSQQMLQSELDIARFNLIDQITDLFLDDFCIRVY